MIIDRLTNAPLYYGLHPRLRAALDYLQTTDVNTIAPGNYPIEGADMFAIVSEYETLDAADEEMESHRKYFDVQYMVHGTELVGHALLCNQEVSKAYDDEEDFMLYSDAPDYFSKLEEGMFMVFFPSDLHMPRIRAGHASAVKKIVVKSRIN